MVNNTFVRFQVLIVALVLLSGFVHGLGLYRVVDDDVPDNEIKKSHEASSCTCREELKSVQKRLAQLESSFAEYKASEDDRRFYLKVRTDLITKEILKEEPTAAVDNNEVQVIKQGKFFQDQILDANLLKKIAANIWSTVLAVPQITTEKLFLVFERTLESSPSLYVPMYEFLFDYLDALGNVPENLEKLIETLKIMLGKARSAPSIAWTEELQTKMIRRIFTNINSDNSWPNIFNLVSTNFFNLFPSLPELNAYDIMVNVLDNSNQSSLLSSPELDFIKKIYYSSSYFDNLADNLETIWEKVFLKPKVRRSIENEILFQVKSNFTDAGRIGLKYFKNWSSISTEVALMQGHAKENLVKRSEKSDFMRSYSVKIFLDAIQQGQMTYDRKDPGFFKFLQTIGTSQAIVRSYSFFTAEYKAIVEQKFKHNYTNFESIREFLESVDKASVPIEVWKFFIESMRDNHRMNGNEAFQLGELLQESDRSNDSIWDDLPMPVKLIFNTPKNIENSSKNNQISSKNAKKSPTNTKWRVKVHRANHSDTEFFDIICNQDLSIALVPINSTGNYSTTWNFDKYDPWFAYKRLDVGYSEVSGNLVTFTIQASKISSKGKVMLGPDIDEAGTRLLEQSQDFVGPEKDGMSYNVFKPSLNINLQVFHLSLLMVSEDMPMAVERFVSVVYDEEKNPVGLGVTSDRSSKAEFILFRDYL